MYGFIADIHLGVKLPKEDFMKSLNEYLRHIKEFKEPCHGIFVCGDLFDHRMNVEEARFACLFLLNLVCNNCGESPHMHAPVYFIHGTFTHDQEQYNIFMPMLEKLDNVHVMYADKACAVTLFDGKKALFLPQEYGDVDYSELFKDTYDIIVGHGPIASQTKNPCKSAKYEIIHSAELLVKISKICVFGHYHGYTDFGNGVYYAGPWLKWQFGADEDDMFFYCDDKYNVTTIHNPYAMEFRTVEIQTPEQLREALSKDTSTPCRFIINAAHDDIDTYHGIMNANKTNEHVKFQLTEIQDEDDLMLSVDEVIDAQSEAVQPVPALVSYIKDKYGLDTEEELAHYESQINKEAPNESER